MNIKTNIAYRLLEAVNLVISNTVIYVILSRHFTTSELGTYSLIASLVWFFSSSTFSEAIIKTTSRDLLQRKELDKATTFSSACFVLAIMVSIACVLAISSIYSFEYFQKYKNLLIVPILLCALGNFFRISEAVLQSEERFRLIALCHIFFESFNILLVAYMAKNDFHFKYFAIQTAIFYPLSGLLTTFTGRTFRLFKFQNIKPYYFKYYFIQAVPLVVMIIASKLYIRIDIVMIEYFCGIEAVGKYAVPYSILDNLMVISNLVIIVLFPGFSRYIFDDFARFQSLYKSKIKIVVKYLFPIAILIMIFSGDILALLFGESFRTGSVLLSILMVAALFAWLNAASGIIFISLKKQNIYMWGTIFSFIVNFTLNLLLIPQIGPLGSAIATVFTEACILIWSLWFIRKQISWLPFLGFTKNYI